MASLRLMVASEISDQRKTNMSGNLTARMLHSKNCRMFRKRLLDRDSVRCFHSYVSIGVGKTVNMPLLKLLSPCVVFHQLHTSSVKYDGTRTRVLNGDDRIQSAAEFVHEGESRTLAQPDSNARTFRKDGHHSHLKKLENSHSKRRRTRKKQIVSDRVNKRKNWEPISRKSKKTIYVRSDVAFSSIEINASINYCNRILKDLEQTSEEKALEFFDWMKRHGKLNGNSYAYNLAIRVLSRKENWNSVEALLEDMKSDPECHLNSQIFNSIIFICAKRGRIGRGTWWFRLMLENGLQPNVATIGMLMGLYRIGSRVSEAEYVFDKMRKLNLHNVASYSAMITIYTRQGMYHKAEEIIHLMNEDEVAPNFENLLVQLNSYCQQGKLSEAESVLESIQESELAANIGVFNTMITGYGKVGDIESAERIFRSLTDAGLDPDEVTYRQMVECYGRSDNYLQAKWYYEELKRSGFYPNSSNFYTMINLQAKHEDEAGVIQTLMDMKAMKCQLSSILTTLIQAYDRVGRIERILPILSSSLYHDILIDASSCSVLVLAFVRNSLLDDALKILQEKRWVDSSYEGQLYHTLICFCKEAGRYEDAVKIFSWIPKLEASTNLHIVCSMIDVYSSMNRFNDAEALYLNFKSSGVPLDMIAYSIVVRMYVKSGSLDDACIVLDTIEKSKDIEPDVYLYRDMLRIYQQCKLHEKLANVYYRMCRKEDLWDEAMYNCVINCCGHSLPTDEISRLFEEMIERKFAPSTITFNVMIDIYGKAGLLRKAKQVFEMAKERGLVDVISYNTLIAAYGHHKDFKSMKYAVEQMQRSGHPISLEVYNCMLDAYGKEDKMEEFNLILDKMRRVNCSSDHYTYNIMINIYGKKGWIEDVSNVLAELRNHGLEPDLYSYNTLIKAYGVAGMPEEAVGVVKEMKAKGIELDRVTFVNVISALQRNEHYLDAVMWSLWLREMEKKA